MAPRTCDNLKQTLLTAALVLCCSFTCAQDAASCKQSDTYPITPLSVAGRNYEVQFDVAAVNATAKSVPVGPADSPRSICGVAVHDDHGAIVWQQMFARPSSAVDLIGTAYKLVANRGGEAIVLEVAAVSPGRINSGWITILHPANGRLEAVTPNLHFYGRVEHIPDKGPNVRQLVPDDVIRYQFWAGHYYLINLVRVDLRSGTLSHSCEQNCTLPVICSPKPTMKEETVSLYERPMGNGRKVELKPNINLECLEAYVENMSWSDISKGGNEPWLHVRVNGIDGWMRDDADLERLGLERVERTPDSLK